MCYKHCTAGPAGTAAAVTICVSMWLSVTVTVYGFKYTILMKDHELVGEDPVLMQELRRRMPAVPELQSVIAGEGGAVEDLDEARKELVKQISEMTDGRGDNGILNATVARSVTGSGSGNGSGSQVDSEEQTYIARQQDRKNKGYINHPDDTVLDMFALRMIEQAIYSVQYRLKEAHHYTKKYENDPRYRMGYIFKQLEQWIYEMEVMYTYMTKPVRKNDKKFNVHKNLIYYSHFVRKNFDITYTIYHLLQIHTEFHAFVKKMKAQGPGAPGSPTSGFERPDRKDIDMNDPNTMKMMMDMMPDYEYD